LFLVSSGHSTLPGKYERGEQFASGIIGLSLFVMSATMFFGRDSLVSELGEKIGMAIFLAEFLISAILVYVLLKE
jgi:hypothetical protein